MYACEKALCISKLAIKIPSFNNCVTCSMLSILNFLYLINLFEGLRFRIMQKPLSFFGTKKTLLSQPEGLGDLTSFIKSLAKSSAIFLSMKLLPSADIVMGLGYLFCTTFSVNSNLMPFMSFITFLSLQMIHQNGRKCQSLPLIG